MCEGVQVSSDTVDCDITIECENGVRKVQSNRKKNRTGDNRSFKRVQEDATPCTSRAQARVMDGGANQEWFTRLARSQWATLDRGNDGRPISTPVVKQGETEWGFESEGFTIPMPSDEEVTRLKAEADARKPGQPFGVHSARFLRRVKQWAVNLRKKCFGKDSDKVTGVLRQAILRWKSRLSHLSSDERQGVVDMLINGVRVPFSERPKGFVGWDGHRLPGNHKDLHQKAELVWKTLSEQILERSVQPWDVQGKGPPQGVYPIRWVTKSGTDKVRVTINMRPLNKSVPDEAATVTLDTANKLRNRFLKDSYLFGLDIHNCYYHVHYRKKDRGLLCFSIARGDIPDKHFDDLWARYPAARYRSQLIFCYVGLAMGASASCRQVTDPLDHLLRYWLTRKLKDGCQWDGTRYIDDSMFMVHGQHLPDGGFKSALRLSLSLLAEHIILGVFVNLDKTLPTVIPSRWMTHIGLMVDCRSCTWSLPDKRVKSIRCALDMLRKEAVVGSNVCAKLVASLLGKLWSIHVVAHSAVSILTRAMTDTIAKMLNRPELTAEKDPDRLRRLLRQVWGGDVVWTKEAHRELMFWLTVAFDNLKSPFSYDVGQQFIKEWITSPLGYVSDTVRVFAVDSSDTGSGGGEFMRDGEIWRLDPRTGFFLRLPDSSTNESSTLRELRGAAALILMIPAGCRRIVLLLDSQAAVRVLQVGSKISVLQQIVTEVYLFLLKRGCVLVPCWRRRDTRILTCCDARSRFVDSHTFFVSAAVFWRCNEIARKVWGSGFQFDRAADSYNVQPVDKQQRLPFNSRWMCPHSSGVDMFQQDWSNTISWCNAPFAMAGRVISLLRSQRAAAAVLLPKNKRSWWFRLTRPGCPGVRFVHSCDFSIPGHYMGGKDPPSRFACGLMVVFFDFRRRPRPRVLPSAESICFTPLDKSKPVKYAVQHRDNDIVWESGLVT